jgi:hypothetical protein
MLGASRAMLVGDGLRFYPEGVWSETYAALAPGTAQWPLVGVGEGAGGPNVQNPWMAWVYGNDQAGLESEAARLSNVPMALNLYSAELKWQTAKAQRGLKDPATGFEAAPMRALSYEYARLAYRLDSLLGTSYGGFLPGPATKPGEACWPVCASPPCDIPTRENKDIFFTSTRPDVTTAGLHHSAAYAVPWPADPTFEVWQIHYAGTCMTSDMPGAPDYSQHILYFWRFPLGWVVILNDGTEDFLPAADWVLGPFTQVDYLSRDFGDQVQMTVNAFNREFRGSDGQRIGGYNLENALDAQAYYTEQNYLAPAYGTQVGEAIEGKYPAWELSAGTYGAGQKFPCNYTGTAYSMHPGFVASHAFVALRSTDTTKAASLLVTWTGQGVPLALSATTNGDVVRITPAARLDSVEVSLVGDTVLAAGESIIVEMTELEACTPTMSDFYAMVRKGGARLVGGGLTTDGSGTDENYAFEIGRDYFTHGVAANQHDVSGISDPTSVNENAVYDAARRFVWQNVRLVNRFQFLDYAVEGGDSILWFTPYPRTDEFPMVSPEDDGEQQIDLFGGMGDIAEASTSGESNRWLLDVMLSPFTPPETGTQAYRLDLFGDLIPDANRCLCNDQITYLNEAFNSHTNRGGTLGFNVYAQAPSGWNYAQMLGIVRQFANDTNLYSDEERINFAKSCRVYEPPVEVRKIEYVNEGNRTLVKVTLKGRLHNSNGETDGAPDSIPRSGFLTGGDDWDHAALAAEPFASVERNLRLYLYYRWKDDVSVSDVKQGDHALTAFGVESDQFGALIPHFSWVRLIPSARLDTNDDQDPEDSLFDHGDMFQAVFYLRYMAEGCVGGTDQMTCANPDTERVYDWKFTDLCQHLFGLGWVGMLGTVATTSPEGEEMLAETDVRPDAPEGWGPLPTLKASSEVFNRCVAVVNELNRYRVMLPWEAQSLAWFATAGQRVAASGTCGDTGACAPPSAGSIASGVVGPAATGLVQQGDWEAFSYPTVINAFTDCSFTDCSYDIVGDDIVGGIPVSNGDFTLATNRRAYEVMFDLSEPHIYKHAIPPAWRGMYNEQSNAIGAIASLTQWTRTVVEVDGGSIGCFGDHSCEFELVDTTRTICTLLPNGVVNLDCGAYAPGGWKLFTNADPCSYGTRFEADLVLMGNTVPILTVPVVDREEWDPTPALATQP